MLRQRPDVRAAEHQVTVASARLAQANALRAPNFTLGGSLGLSALTLGTLTNGASVVSSMLAGASLPVFHGGALSAQVRAQRAALDQAQLAYQTTVLTALAEVEDSLIALADDRERLRSLEEAAEAAAHAALLAQQQYNSGLVDFQVVLETQRALLSTQEGVALARAALSADHVFLYKAKILSDGSLAGDFWSGMVFHEKWTGKRDAVAELPNAYGLTAMRPGTQHFDFAFPDLSGKTVSSQGPQFRGKVLIVALAGSWCPNCHDEAAFLAPLYRDYRGKGLEIVSLMFEHFGDFPRAAEATLRFRQHYGIEYTTLIAGISNKDEAAKQLPMLQSFVAFPTTIFIDRKGNVRKIHTGYSGPATGDHYEQFVKEVKTTLDQLLAESNTQARS